MKRLISFYCLLGFIFVCLCNCQSKAQNANVAPPNDTYAFADGEVAVIQSNTDAQGFYYKLYVYSDTENPDGIDSLLCAKLLFSEDEKGGCEISQDSLDNNSNNKVKVKFSKNADWQIYDCYLCGDSRLNLCTDMPFVNSLYKNDTLFVQCQVSDDETDLETFTFDISKIHK